MRAVVIELAWLAGGLSLALATTAAAVWAYPPGADAIRATGLAAAVAVVALGLAPLRDAWRRDRDGD